MSGLVRVMIQFFHHKLACDKITALGGFGNHTVSRLIGEPGPGAVRFRKGGFVSGEPC